MYLRITYKMFCTVEHRFIQNSSKLYFWQGFKNYSQAKNTSNTTSQDIEMKRKALMARGLPKQKPLPGVKQILLVASGKGGVGKSTTAVNLSTALKIMYPKKSIGLLDADVFGPSVPLMMNIHESPLINNANLMEPLINYGVKCMSMGFLVDEKTPVVWRGLMVMSALDKLLHQVMWAPLDCLVIDTPPGTGDTLLSLIQNLCLTGALLVTTPQKAAVDVTSRGAQMFQKLNVPIAGIVENMSSVTCPNCATEVPIFGDNIQILADELGIQLLQRIPLHENITACCDSGKPVVLSAPRSAYAEAYRRLAININGFLESQPFNEN